MYNNLQIKVRCRQAAAFLVILVVVEEDGFLNESLGRKHGESERLENVRDYLLINKDESLLCWSDYIDAPAAASTLLDLTLLVNE